MLLTLSSKNGRDDGARRRPVVMVLQCWLIYRNRGTLLPDARK